MLGGSTVGTVLSAPLPLPHRSKLDVVSTTSVAARFAVVREQPMVAVDLATPAPALPLVEQGIYRTVVEAGLVPLDRFYGVELPRGARLGWTLEADELRLVKEDESGVLTIPRTGVDPVWEAASLRLRGSMFVLGHELGLTPDQTPQELCDALDRAGRGGVLAGAIVGVAEPRQGLPLFF